MIKKSDFFSAAKQTVKEGNKHLQMSGCCSVVDDVKEMHLH